MYDKVVKTIDEYNMLEYGDRVVVGLSGGADSVALLMVLMEVRDKYGISIEAVHINHNLRGDEADADEAFCVELCDKYSIPIHVYSYDVSGIAKISKRSEEEVGRECRYNAFNNHVGSNDKIATAHNANDTAETLLMNIMRGSGIKGLSGIPAKRDNIIRPLINISRDEIEEYNEKNGQQYRTDSTNNKTVYTRNKIRLEVLPYIKENFNKNIVNALNNTAKLLQQEDEYLDLVARNVLENITVSENTLDLSRFNKLDDVMKRRVIRLMIENYCGEIKDISYKNIEDVIRICKKDGEKSINLVNNIVIKKQYETISIYTNDIKQKDTRFDYTIKKDHLTYIKEYNIYVYVTNDEKNIYKYSNLDIVNIKKFCYDKIGELHLRSRMANDKIYIKSINGTKKIKDYFVDTKTPKDKRDNVPLFAVGNDVIWIVDDKNIVNGKYSTDENENIQKLSIIILEDKE